MKTINNKILDVIIYFDVFHHPMKIDELKNLFSDTIDDSLQELVDKGVCYEKTGYYSIQKNITELINEREKKEKNAEKYIRKIPFFVKIMKRFPFVRGIAISGSLSKGVMYEDGDIDYFIITAPNRLWIARTFLIAFKKIILLNSRKHFCINYFVDENNLKIQDENIFTAVELSFLNPVYNIELFDKFNESNNFAKDYIPNNIQVFETKKVSLKSKMRSFSEWILNGKIGESMDKYFMKITLKRWKNKFY